MAGIPMGIPNSKRLLRAVFDRRGVRVQRATSDELPLVDGRCSPHGWCLVETGKDCRPASWVGVHATRPCEELNMTVTQRELYRVRFMKRGEIPQRLTAGVSMNEAR